MLVHTFEILVENKLFHEETPVSNNKVMPTVWS